MIDDDHEGYEILADVLELIRDQDQLEVVRYPDTVRQGPTNSTFSRNPYLFQSRPPYLLQGPWHSSEPVKTIVETTLKTESHRELLSKAVAFAYKTPYFFLLGVTPLTLATLTLLGHPPFQVLLIGAYIVTVYLFASKGQFGLLKRVLDTGKKSDETKAARDLPYLLDQVWQAYQDNNNSIDFYGHRPEFSQVLKWVENSDLLRPLLSEPSWKFLYQASFWADEELEL